jgi:hypothetical protein
MKCSSIWQENPRWHGRTELAYLQMGRVLYIHPGLGGLLHHSSHCTAGLGHHCHHVLGRSQGGLYEMFPGQTRDCLRSYVLVRQHPIYWPLANTHHSIHAHTRRHTLITECKSSAWRLHFRWLDPTAWHCLQTMVDISESSYFNTSTYDRHEERKKHVGKYRVQQASFLSDTIYSIQKRKLACRTLYM